MRGRRTHAIPVVPGSRVGMLRVLREVEPDPHYGKRALYKCEGCGDEAERICGSVRLQRRRLEQRARRAGRDLAAIKGPSCTVCAWWVSQ